MFYKVVARLAAITVQTKQMQKGVDYLFSPHSLILRLLTRCSGVSYGLKVCGSAIYLESKASVKN